MTFNTGEVLLLFLTIFFFSQLQMYDDEMHFVLIQFGRKRKIFMVVFVVLTVKDLFDTYSVHRHEYMIV